LRCVFYNNAMTAPVLATKLYIPSPRSTVVHRPRLIERLNEGLRHMPGVTLISAPAGFGKTTLVSEWVDDIRLAQTNEFQHRVAWLSLDEGDNDPSRFLTYLIAALQTISESLGARVLGMLQVPQPPPPESILTSLLNEIASIPHPFLLVLDDYHAIDSRPIDQALQFLLEHQPPQMHLVITTREDPDLPLARLRARGQLTELRVTDLRFTLTEAADFLHQATRVQLSEQDIAALETRTEGWIAGLQLAALSLQGHVDTASFIQSFTGSHHFVMDYLLAEVLHQQPERIQRFLLHTSILDRMCGPVCDAVLLDPFTTGQETLESLERSNLFIISLDDERRWYRYHHLFADLLRQKLRQHIASHSGSEQVQRHLNELHIRASQWYEEHDLAIEAFHHAAAARDIERVERLIGGDRISQHLRGAVTAILDWLASLPASVLDERPWLQWRYASLLLVNGQTIGVEEKLLAAETAITSKLQGAEPDEQTRNLIGQIAAARSVLALTRYQVDMMLAQAQRALEYLLPQSMIPRSTALWTMGFAYMLQGDRAAARMAFMEAISISQKAGDIFTTILATLGLGNVQELENQLSLAAETYRHVLQLAGDQPLQIIHDAHLGLARVLYEWNDLDAAQEHGEKSLQLARQYERVIDRYIMCEVFLARLKLARGDGMGALALLDRTEQSVHRSSFMHRLPEVVAARGLALLRQGNVTAAAQLAQTYTLPLLQARVHLAQGDPSAALAILEPVRQQEEAKDWKDELLKVLVLQAVALAAHGERDRALQGLVEALEQARPGGFVRIFVDEGPVMAQLLEDAAAQGIMPEYVGELRAAFEAGKRDLVEKAAQPPAQGWVEPLSPRELDVLRLVAQGLTNEEIGKRLFLALDTVKGHNRRIFDKLQVQRRTEAVARARELGLL
jgi:LuxR family transcriptional regulator, maltose regulon positive regulatory protein